VDACVSGCGCNETALEMNHPRTKSFFFGALGKVTDAWGVLYVLIFILGSSLQLIRSNVRKASASTLCEISNGSQASP